jgi:Kip1 ubiquitination-promoting complex protein 1
VTLSSPWKQEAMYAACAWIVQMLLAVSKRGTIFSYVPEVYVESLVSRRMHFGPFPCCAVAFMK